MQPSVGMPSPMVMTARHLVKRAPSSLYSASLSCSPSRPWVNFSLGERGKFTVLLSTFMPGITPWSSSTFEGLLPEGLIVEDHAREELAYPGGCEEHLPVGAPTLLAGLYAHRLEPLADGAEALVGGEDTLPRRYEFAGGLFEIL